MEKNLLLLAEVQNWGLMRAPCWKSTTWRIYSDRSYVVESQFLSKPDEDEDQRLTMYSRPITKSQKRGKMRMNSFEKLLAAMETDPWRSPGLNNQACDGEGWKIEMYGPDGTVIRSSGNLGYIYGEKVLETIAGLLPGSKT